jgi:zinc protease
MAAAEGNLVMRAMMTRFGGAWTRRLLAPAVLVLLLGGLAGPAAAMDIERVVSPGGVEAWLVQDHSLPIVALSLAFRGGAALDPAAKSGLATMVSATIDEGAGPLDSAAFQRQLSDLGIDLRFDAGQDEFTGTLRSLTRDRDQAFELLRLALTEPRFDEEPVERVRNQLLAVLASDAEDPGKIAGDTLSATLFPDHPYGRDPMGTAETLGRITRADLQAFAKARFARDRLVLGVVGDITPAELGPALDRIFGGLPATSAAIDLPEAVPEGAGRVVVVERDVPQSVILLAQPGIKRDDPDFYAAALLMQTLGGGFGSRLTRELREKRGLAYSIGADLATYELVGLVTGSTATQNARAKESIDLIRQVWGEMAEKGPTEAELDDARDYIVGSYALRFTSSSRIANNLVALQLEDLGIDYMAKRSALFAAVTLEDAKRVAKRLLDPAKLAWVVVGKPDGVASTP